MFSNLLRVGKGMALSLVSVMIVGFVTVSMDALANTGTIIANGLSLIGELVFDSDGEIVKAEVAFGDGRVEEIMSTPGIPISLPIGVRHAKEGKYTVQVKARNEQGQEGTLDIVTKKLCADRTRWVGRIRRDGAAATEQVKLNISRDLLRRT